MLQNTASIAGLLLTTEAVVTEKPEARGQRRPSMPAVADVLSRLGRKP